MNNSLRQDWDDLSALDPFWAILSDRTKQFGLWEADEFFSTGVSEISGIMRHAADLDYPKEHRHALDFGCGVGRLTRAMCGHFDSCTGVDISAGMIARARSFTPECQFHLLDHRQLRIFSDRSFDMIYSNIVLQHQPSVTIVQEYIREFVRLLCDGGLLVFQLPHRLPIRLRLQPRRRLYQALHSIGVGPRFLYNTLHLNPIRMLALPQRAVVELLAEAGARVLKVVSDQNGGPKIESRTYYATVARASSQ